MKAWGDEQLEKIVSGLLIAGVSLSAAVVLIGGLGLLWQLGAQGADYHTFRGVAEQYRSFRGTVRAAASLDWRGMIQLGLVMLIITPIARVAFSLVGFALERDTRYAALTALVLAILIYSFVAPH